jgi:hypothetical protein
LRYSGADTRPACELHTHSLWVAKSDADGNRDGSGKCYADSYTYTDGNTNSYSHSNGHNTSS